MYAAVRQYRSKTGMADQLAERVKDLVPVISGVSASWAITSSTRPTTW